MIVILKPDCSDEMIAEVQTLVESDAQSCQLAVLDDEKVLFAKGVGDREVLRRDLQAREEVLRVVDLSGISEVTRRSFLDLLIFGAGGGLTLGILASLGLFIMPPEEVLDPSGEIAIKREDVSPRGSKTFLIRNRPAIVVESYGKYYALASTCTHSDVCTVEWSREKQQLICPCHRGIFDVRGNVLEGPPPRALPQFEVNVVGDTIFISDSI